MKRMLFWYLSFLSFFFCDKLLTVIRGHVKGLRSTLPPTHYFHWMSPRKQIAKVTIWVPPSPIPHPLPLLISWLSKWYPSLFRGICQELGVIFNLETSFCFTFHNHNWPVYFISFECFSPSSMPLINHPHILPILLSHLLGLSISTFPFQSIFCHSSDPLKSCWITSWSISDLCSGHKVCLIWPLLVCPGLPDISFSLAAPCLKVHQLRGVPPHSRAHFSPHLQISEQSSSWSLLR